MRTALVTARSAPAHERAIRTLMEWQIEVDEAMFLGGLPKGEFLREFEPDFFFDDQTRHVENAASHVPSGHVAAGIELSSVRRRQASAAGGVAEAGPDRGATRRTGRRRRQRQRGVDAGGGRLARSASAVSGSGTW